MNIVFCFSVHSQTGKVYNDSLKELYELTSEALDNYEYLTSIDQSLKLIDLASKKDNYYYLYHGYSLLGISYASMEDMSRAEDNHLKALEYAVASGNDTILWWAYNNLGNIYSQNEKTVAKGLAYYDKAIHIIRRIEDFENGIDPILNKGWTYLDQEQYDRALPYLLKVQELTSADRKPVLNSTLQALLGMYYGGKENYERSRCFFETSIQIAERDSLILQAAVAYEEYAQMLYKSGAAQEAYLALQKHLEFQDMLFEEEKLHHMEAAYTQFKTKEYQKDLAVAKREQQYKDEVIAKSKQVSNILIFFSVLMLLFLILLYRNNRIRKTLIGQLKEKNSELKTAKDKAEQFSLSKSRFFSTVSHELRTPLYGVVGLTSLLLEDNKNKKQEEDLKSLKFSADYLLALINDVLQMNKMESNLLHLENMQFNIENLMIDIVNSFQFSKHQSKNNIELHIDEEIPQYLIGDSVRLSQILMNLMGNALKFTERGKIWISAKRKKCDDHICRIHFEVGDTGIGIPASKQEEIFEEFSQLRSTNYNYQGTGLGLPIVKKLLFLFGSEIKLKSEEGKGAVFYFEIDFEIAQAATEDAKAKAPVETLSENRDRKILVVDDNRINQIVTKRILEKRNFICLVAGSGEEAIKKITSENIDLVLMDVNMPGMNGMETTIEIRKTNKDIPVIALTAVEIEEMREEIMASGMNDIIVKPYDIPQFFHTIFRNLPVSVE